MHLVVTSNPDALARAWRDQGALHVQFSNRPRASFPGGEIRYAFKVGDPPNTFLGTRWRAVSVEMLDAGDITEAGTLLHHIAPYVCAWDDERNEGSD